MAAVLHSESRRLYSWWWDSHIPKNSKWLQENLTDMDAKVKTMIKLIEEDADSFARRAEMYYKKRPELMKLVEEFYRAYRALAERYDHATVELRHAHRTMAEAFPNHVPYELPDDSPSGEPHTPEMPHPIRYLYDPDVNEQNLQKGSSETEIQTLKKTLTEIEAEKEAIFLKYQQALEKLSNLERELNHAQKDTGGLEERACKAEIEVKILKEALSQLGAERDAGLLQYNQCLEKLSNLEISFSLANENAKGLDKSALEAKTEAQSLKQQISRLEAEKEASLLQYKQCLEKLSVLEAKVTAAGENARVLNEKIEKAEAETIALKKALDKLNDEKEEAFLKYQQCLEIITKMESELSHAQVEAERKKEELMITEEKLESTEERCSHLEESNQSLQLEAETLVEEIKMKDQLLLQKHDELKNLQILMHEEQSCFLQVETTLKNLQKLHNQSQEEQKSLTLELKNGLQMLNDLDTHKHEMEEQLEQIKEENKSLNELNFCSAISIKNLENEISSLKEMKEKLEEEVVQKADQSNTLGQEIPYLREDIKGLNERYQAIVEQVTALGLNPECFSSSVKNLQDENAELRQACENDRNKREALYDKLSCMDKLSKENTILGISLAKMNGELAVLKEKAKQFQESCQFLQGEKSSLVEEKATVLSQLQIITETMQNLLERNAFLENSLCGANVELEGLREKSKSLEEFCEFLNNEKSNLQDERSALVSRLEEVESRLGNLEKRFLKLEENYSGLESEKLSTLYKVEELRSSLSVEKQEHANYKQSTDARLVNLENNVNVLQEERKLGKKEFEEELEKAVNAQIEIFILQKFVEDLDAKNMSLFIECQKHDEASKLSDKLIRELEVENLEQQLEINFLCDEIEKSRAGIYQIFRALQFDLCHENKIEQKQIPMVDILDMIDNMKTSLFKNMDEKEQLMVENSVLFTLLEQLKFEGTSFESEKNIVEQELKIANEHLAMREKENHELVELKKQLMLEISQREKQQTLLKAEFNTLNVKLINLRGAYRALQEENSNTIEENRSLLEKFVDLKAEKDILDEEHNVILQEATALSIFSLVSKSFMNEKAVQIKAVFEDFQSILVVDGNLKEEKGILGEKLEMKEAENLDLKESVEKLNKELYRFKELNDQLSYQILLGNDFLRRKAEELSKAEQEIKDTRNLNIELCNTIDELRKECEESIKIRENLENKTLELSETSKSQKKEIEYLHEENKNLESEVSVLCMEIEERRVREEYLNSELQVKRDEFELWEAEAATFYFDLQLSSVNEVLLVNKVCEITHVCDSIGDESAAKSVEIQWLRERVNFLESETKGLKTQLSAYLPVVAALKDNVESLERTVLPPSNHFWSGNEDERDEENAIHFHDKSCKELNEDQHSVIPNGISDLQQIEARIKVVEAAMLKEKERLAKKKVAAVNFDAVKKSTKALKSEGISYQGTDNLKPHKSKPENGILMKDIQLDQVSDSTFYGKNKKVNSEANDQMLKLWQMAELECSKDKMASKMQKQEIQKSRDSLELEIERELGIDRLEVSSSVIEQNQEQRKGQILEKLAFDARKLSNIQTTAQGVKKRMEMKKWSQRAGDIEYETVKRQLREVEEDVVQMGNANVQLLKDIEHVSSSLEEGGNVSRENVAEQARKWSEKIEQLQFEVQKIEHVLLKLEDKKKRNGKNRFRIYLRDLIYRSGRRGERRKKGRFCGCTRPSTSFD